MLDSIFDLCAIVVSIYVVPIAFVVMYSMLITAIHSLKVCIVGKPYRKLLSERNNNKNVSSYVAKYYALRYKLHHGIKLSIFQRLLYRLYNRRYNKTVTIKAVSNY